MSARILVAPPPSSGTAFLHRLSPSPPCHNSAEGVQHLFNPSAFIKACIEHKLLANSSSQDTLYTIPAPFDLPWGMQHRSIPSELTPGIGYRFHLTTFGGDHLAMGTGAKIPGPGTHLLPTLASSSTSDPHFRPLSARNSRLPTLLQPVYGTPPNSLRVTLCRGVGLWLHTRSHSAHTENEVSKTKENGVQWG